MCIRDRYNSPVPYVSFFLDTSTSPVYNTITDFAADAFHSIVGNSNTFRSYTWRDNEEGETLINTTEVNFLAGSGNVAPRARNDSVRGRFVCMGYPRAGGITIFSKSI